MAGADLTLRSGPGPRFAAITTMPAGATVDVGGCTGRWCQVAYGGTQGYANRSCLGMGSAGVAVEPGYDTYEPDYGYYDDYAYYGDYGYGGMGFGFGFDGRRHHRRHGHGHGRCDGHHDRGPRTGSLNTNQGSLGQRSEGGRNFVGRTFAPQGGTSARSATFGSGSGGGTVGAGASMRSGWTVGAGVSGGGGGGGRTGGGGGGHGGDRR